MPQGYRNSTGEPIRSMLGRTHTPETRAKIGRANSGRKFTEEHRRKIGLARIGKYRPWLGRKHSEETKEKIRQAHLGKPRPEYVRRRLSEMVRKSLCSRGSDFRRSSKSEIAWGKRIEERFGIQLKPSVWIGGRCFDFCWNKILFELDGSFWHSFERKQRVDKLKDDIARDNGYTLIRFQLDRVADVERVVTSNLTKLKQIFEG